MKMQVDVYTPEGEHCSRIITEHIDACKSITIISSINNKYKPDSYITESIDHFNIFHGLVTIFYRSGAFIEIIKLKPGQID